MSDLPQPVRPYSTFINDPFVQRNGHHVTSCPFCETAKHLYINSQTGQGDCKKCGWKGNAYSFVKAIHSGLVEGTTEKDLRTLAKLRKICDHRIFKDAEVAVSTVEGSDGLNAYVPHFNTSGSLVNLRRWDGPGTRLIPVAGLSLHLFGEELFDEKTGTVFDDETLIIICEGEWDALSLSAVLNYGFGKDDEPVFTLSSSLTSEEKLTYKNLCVVAVPGADVFKDEWAAYFSGKNVLVAYDRDNAGERGVAKVCEKLSGKANRLYKLVWPTNLPEKYDLSDFLYDSRKDHAAALASLTSFCVPVFLSENGGAGGKQEVVRERIFKERPSFKTVLKEYRKVLHLDRDMEDGLAAMFAVILSNQISGDPVWLFVVGPPGSGKTTTLLTFADSPRCVFQSSLTPHSLISGYKMEDPEKDPSLIPRLIGNTLVLKDWTEIMSMPGIVQDDLYGVLRGAYDGRAEKTFGNGMERVYSPCHFSILAGVTPAIHSHSRSTLGERFLKLTFIRPGSHDPSTHILAALTGATTFFTKEVRLRSVAYEFLDTVIEGPPEVPMQYIHRLAHLAQVIAELRAGVERSTTGDLCYRPQAEVGTRLAKQLQKLMQGLALVFGLKKADERCYQIAERVAFDSAVGWNLEITAAMINAFPKPLTLLSMVELCRINKSNLNRRIGNMLELGLINTVKLKKTTPGQPAIGYILNQRFVTLWRKAKINTKLLLKRLQVTY